MNQQAQISLFILAGVLLVVAAGLIIYSMLSEEQLSGDLSTFQVEFSDHIGRCLDETAISGAELLAVSGGEIEPDIHTLITEYGNVALFWDYGEAVHRGISRAEDVLEKHIESVIPSCIRSFPNPGLEIVTQSPEAKAVIKDHSVVIEFSPKVKVNQGNTHFSVSKIRSEIDTNLGLLIRNAIGVSEKIATNDYLDLDELSRMDVSVTAMPYTRDAAIYALAEKGEEDSLVFLFGVRQHSNSRPMLGPLPDAWMSEEGIFEFVPDAMDPDGDSLTFSVSGVENEIDTESGQIRFKGSVPGITDAAVCAHDVFDAQECRLMRVVVRDG